MSDVIYRVGDGEIVTITRRINYSLDFILRPYVNKSYVCGGCRKRLIEGKRLLHEVEYEDSPRGWPIYPRIPVCPSDICLNMILLKGGKRLEGRTIVAVPQDVNRDYVKCANCADWGGPNTNRVMLQAWIVDAKGKEKKFATFCSVDCFKMKVSCRVEQAP